MYLMWNDVLCELDLCGDFVRNVSFLFFLCFFLNIKEKFNFKINNKIIKKSKNQTFKTIQNLIKFFFKKIHNLK